MAQSRTTGRVVTRNALKALAYAGALSTAIVAPNSTALIDKYMKHMDKKSARKTLSHLKYKKLIEVREKNGEFQYRLTGKGRDRFEKTVIDEMSISIPTRWDKKWRAVLFDIPVTQDTKRKLFLHKLRALNFYKLQDSVWIHPFECEKEVGALINYLELEKYVSFLVVEKGNFTDHATEHFKKIDILM